MLKNYLKIAFRNLSKHKVTALINIGGLAMGMAVTMLIGLWVWDELSYNKSLKNYDTIAQVMSGGTFNGQKNSSLYLPRPMEAELRNKYGSSFKHIVMSRHTEAHILSFGQQKINQYGRYMQAGAPDMLSLKMLKGFGDLRDPASIIISASTAKALFGSLDPIDKPIRIDNRLDVKVTGVYQDIAHNTEFAPIKFIAPWDLLVTSESWIKEDADNWGNFSYLMYVQIQPNTTFEAVSARIANALHHNVSEETKRFNIRVFLNPMHRWHLYGEWKNGVSGGRIQFVWLFSIIGVFVLLLACINFMNLSTARSEKRAKEVGVRKAIGSGRSQLVKQFLTESFLVVTLSFVFAVLLVVLILPLFNRIANKEMIMVWTNPVFWLVSLTFITITGLLAGSYPAWFLSSFNAAKVLKGSFQPMRLASLPRKVLVVLQFSVSITLIIGTIVVYKQIQHAKNRPIGYDKDGLLAVQIVSDDLRQKLSVLSQELKNSGVATDVALASSPLTSIYMNGGGIEWKAKDPDLVENFGIVSVSQNFGKTVGWELKDGRDFSLRYALDSVASVTAEGRVANIIVNEAAAKYMNMKKAVGEYLKWNDYPFTIVGVIKDNVVESPYGQIRPTIYMVNNQDAAVWMYIRLNPGLTASNAIAKIESIFKAVVPDVPFDYKFADVEYGKKFAAEERMGKLAAIFAFLAIFISCLGLLGLALFVAGQRSKEISIRKVLGATLLNLWGMLSKEFVLLVSIACFVAFPIAWYLLSEWLQNFEYHTEISFWIFGLAGGSAILIALCTVSYHAISAAIANPIKTLRSE